MSAYAIADVRVTDEALFAEFAAGVPATIEAHGGRYIIRGGDIEVIQGDWAPPRFVVVEFESAEAASGWLNSEEFAPHARPAQPLVRHQRDRHGGHVDRREAPRGSVAGR